MQLNLKNYLEKFELDKELEMFGKEKKETELTYLEYEKKKYEVIIKEFWTSKQRKSNSLHEISYRACFKAQLPRFFIKLLTKEKDIIYDPFSGRGTTVIEAGLNNRNIISNDINPISEVLCKPRFFIPKFEEIEKRLNKINYNLNEKADIDLSMFYEKKTEAEIVSLKKYLDERNKREKNDYIDDWIRMIATNRLTGHSTGFFSVYTLPPNQATTQKRQKKINEKRNQKPEYRDTKKLILKKSKKLISKIDKKTRIMMKEIGEQSIFLCKDSRKTTEIKNNTVQLTVTSPPFLDIVQYDVDNWLRCWFNSIDMNEISKSITIARKIEEWCEVMGDVFIELNRITKKNGWVAFEVGEVRNGKIKLEEYVLKIGLDAGFECEAIMINSQNFTKTANLWGIDNMRHGTNTNRIVIFRKV